MFFFSGLSLLNPADSERNIEEGHHGERANESRKAEFRITTATSTILFSSLSGANNLVEKF